MQVEGPRGGRGLSQAHAAPLEQNRPKCPQSATAAAEVPATIPTRDARNVKRCRTRTLQNARHSGCAGWVACR